MFVHYFGGTEIGDENTARVERGGNQMVSENCFYGDEDQMHNEHGHPLKNTHGYLSDGIVQ